MKAKIYLSSFFLWSAVLLFKGYGQCTTNMLINPSFEAPVQPNIGDNEIGSPVFNGWTMPGGTQFNIIRANGSVYGEGPDTAQQGKQYADVVKADGMIQQSFALTCPSAIDLSGYFSRREPGGSGFNSYIEIYNEVGAVVSTSSIVSFTATENQEAWKQVVGTAFLPAGNYTFSFYVDNFANCDNGFLCITPNCVLPLTISVFEATVNQCTIELNWKVETEINVKHYEVEYSEDGSNYKIAGYLQALNNSAQAKYTFKHFATAAGTIFYRLKIINNDGSFTYSKQLLVKNNCSDINVQLVYPNPVKEELKIVVTGLPLNLPSQYLLFNSTGKLIEAKKIFNGINLINMQHLSAGVYFIKVPDAVAKNTFIVTKL